MRRRRSRLMVLLLFLLLDLFGQDGDACKILTTTKSSQHIDVHLHYSSDQNRAEVRRRIETGLPAAYVKDSDTNVLEDLQALKSAGQVWQLSNMDLQEDIVYPDDLKVGIKVDDDLKQLFRSIELPRDMVDIEKDLPRCNMRPATNTAKRRAMAEIHGLPSSKPKKSKKKQKEITKRTKLAPIFLSYMEYIGKSSLQFLDL